MEKYLYFNNAAAGDGQIDAADDVVCYKASDFRGAVQNGTTRTEITLLFAPMFGELELAANAYPASVSDTVVLTITSDKHKEVLAAIIDAINAPMIAGNGKGLIVIADDMNAKYLSVDPDSAGVAVAISGTVNVTQTPAAA